VKWLHAIAHFLGVNDWYYDAVIEDGHLCRVKRCPTCNATDPVYKLKL
jgi:hypothetical protein